MELNELKARYTIRDAWCDLNLPGSPGKCVPSPFREDRSPSFSVWAEGTKAKDFATGESFDVFDFVAKARGCDVAGAIAFVREHLGVPREWKPELKRSVPKIPRLRPSTDTELNMLSQRRGFSAASLIAAQERGFLFFSEMWGHAAWCLTDSRRELFEFRCVDGDKWPAYGRLPARKAHCTGAGKSWPLGVMESLTFPNIAMVEGAPDFLAAIHFLLLEDKLSIVAPVGILGAANHRLAPEALAKFKDKTVWLYPHVDEAGRKAVREWARQLKDAGAARVTAFDLSGLMMVDGTEGKDLADVCRISADCFEQNRKFAEVMP